MLTDDLRREVLHAILHPVVHPPEMREQVQAFLYDRLGIASYEQIYPVAWGSSYRWYFCFDPQGNLVPFVRSHVPYRAVRGFSLVTTLVSHRGPFVTAESAPAIPYEDGGISFKQELPASAKAAALAQAVAKQFGLTYLDAAELYAWELDESVADDAGVDFGEVGWAVPNAFILLFG